MCNFAHVPSDRSPGVEGGLRSRCNRTGDRSDHDGMDQLSGDQIVRLRFSESQEICRWAFVDGVSGSVQPACVEPGLIPGNEPYAHPVCGDFLTLPSRLRRQSAAGAHGSSWASLLGLRGHAGSQEQPDRGALSLGQERRCAHEPRRSLRRRRLPDCPCALLSGLRRRSGQRARAGRSRRTTIRRRDRGFGSAAKLFQARPSKTKQKCLDLLGFIRQNRDLSMGYDDSK